MRGLLPALALFLTSCSSAFEQSESTEQAALRQLKQRLLYSMGMKHFPNMSRAITSDDEMQSMLRKYWKRVRKSETEKASFHHKGCDLQSGIVFQPDVHFLPILQSARLRHLNSTTTDVTRHVHQWAGSNTNLTFSCHGVHNCCHTTLDFLFVEKAIPRTKRSTCSGHCCRMPLTIRFKDIGWDWIIRPKKFEAYYCKGRCKNRTGHFANSHALMQSLMYSKGMDVPKPCCTAKSLKPLDLLHYNDSDPPKLVVTRQKGMIVKKCGCT